MNLDKQLQTHFNSDVKTEMNVKKRQEVEYLLEGTIKPKKSHFIFEIDKITMEVNKASYKADTLIFGSNNRGKEKLITNINCIYIPALNAANALKKYRNNPNQSAYYFKDAPMNINSINFSK